MVMDATTAPAWAAPLPKHPAPYTPEILQAAPALLTGCTKIIDTMAGTGRIFQLAPALPGATLHAVELQPRWAAYDARTWVGNALDLPFNDGSYNGSIISPPYGNRIADKFKPTNGRGRRSYQICYGQDLEPDNIGLLQWGPEYRSMMTKAWIELARILCPGGVFVLNISDHYRNRELQPVTAWHCETLKALGFFEVERVAVTTPRYRNGANWELRPDCEWLIKFVKGAKVAPSFYGSSESVEWYTPPEIVEPARRLLRTITLDPASCAVANQRVGAETWWGPFDWALRRPWGSPAAPATVFVNPPFGRYHGHSNLGLWSSKLVAEYDAGNVAEAILVTTDAVCDLWFSVLKRRFPICFPDGRIAFMGPDGNRIRGNTKGTAVVYLGLHPEQFRQEFSPLGPVLWANW